jgi:hypothetical protein
VDSPIETALDGGFEQVQFAHGDAAGGEEDVDCLEGEAEGGFEGVWTVVDRKLDFCGKQRGKG